MLHANEVLSWTFVTTQIYSIWTNDWFVFHPFKSMDIGGSFTDAPKRTTSSSILLLLPPTIPLLHMGDFRFLETAPSSVRPDFSSLTPTYILLPQLPPTRVIYRPPRRILFHFYGRTG
ncbi:hypothetical protein AVEN_35692-1 [Araneus ventricosus]|uniref:Uncharacterized protein n=1 Tax=Araneus ventricosus TaxID=182803 RepID=A0A4Y2LD96_ARAVE|nr:hypothetical protein AVEN_35692-1 [Araneus ventricosus]